MVAVSAPSPSREIPELRSLVDDRFISKDPERIERTPLLNPTTEEPLATAVHGDVEMDKVIGYARNVGVPALRELSFAARGDILLGMARAIHDRRDDLIDASVSNGGSTRKGAKFDIDGATITLQYYGELAKSLGETFTIPDEGEVTIGQGSRLGGRHIWVSKGGVAVFINAFNFPIWGLAEKAATALFAGMPVINKPATATALPAVIMAEALRDADILPPGTFQQVLTDASGVRELLSSLRSKDFVAFTGSGGVAREIREHPVLLDHNIALNVEADSLNTVIVDPGIDPESDLWGKFIDDVVHEMSEKSGQKCTATRRILIPRDLLEQASQDLIEKLSELKIGNPANKDVHIGPLATRRQIESVHRACQELRGVAQHIFGQERPDSLIDVPEGKGFFCGPMLFVAESDGALDLIHSNEVFGPVACLLPYGGKPDQAISLTERGGGMLVSSIYSDNLDWMSAVAAGIASDNGRVCLVDGKSIDYTLPSGMVLPQLIHGGPGHAGGGQELGGLRGVKRFMNLVAYEGSRALMNRLFSESVKGA